MSTWTEIEDSDDVVVSENGKELDVLYGHDYFGNKYISIPIDFVKRALKEAEDA